MHLNLRRALVAAATALALAAPLAGCGTGTPVVAAPAAVVEPAAYGPTYGGQLYCGYVFIPAECWGVPGTPMLMPTSTPLATDLLAVAMYHHFLTYEPSYYGGWGWDRYERNARRTNVTIVMSKTTYIHNGDSWGRAHAAEVKKYSANAPYKSTQGGKTTTVRGDKYATAANKSADLSTAKDARKTGAAGNATAPKAATVTTEKQATSKTTTSGGSKYTSGGTAPKTNIGGTVRRK